VVCRDVMDVGVVPGGLALVALYGRRHVAVLVAVVITATPGIGEHKTGGKNLHYLPQN